MGLLNSVGTGSPNRLLYSLGTGAAAEPATQEVAVSKISGSSVRKGKTWRAQATVTIRDLDSDAIMSNVTVTGGFSTQNGALSCVTDGNSRCTITSDPISADRTDFTVTNVSGPYVVYLSDQNSQVTLQILQP